MNALNADFLEDVVDSAVERIADVVIYLMDQLAQNGLVYGDVEIQDDAEFAAWYLDLQQRGVLEFLPVISMKLYNEYTNRFQRVSAQLMGVA